MRSQLDTIEKINALRKSKNAVILAHYYQEEAIQDIADFVGDSLELAKKAAETSADIIVFAGVYFMAETAKILNSDKKVLVPDLNAGCSLADGCPATDFAAFLKNYPQHKVVTYINTSAEVKALSDYVCTSSNAEKVINAIPKEQPIIFAPDKNLGAYLNKVTGRNMLLWDGSCIVHEAFSIDKLIELHLEYPTAKIVAHPESEDPILRVAHCIGSTSQMLQYIRNSEDETFIVATEAGILHQLKKQLPYKTLIPAPAREDNSCACSECAFMKMNTLEKLYRCLRDETPEVTIDEILRLKAIKPIEQMLAL
ncbi:quinolinate synthase NadA [Antarcticibacterium arcticum]|uniref:Quinolinate synthase n=1 Tax=Antarcticibacterium arcticum TaxID=2585771 RepID=A0A5B8YJQ2_9FLAO|nr:quinolinate synthase NadA [Antarcticibacterium arcticum]QED37348.1 quinolinate synthase NadA [Antarcticibacterium arcticum]